MKYLFEFKYGKTSYIEFIFKMDICGEILLPQNEIISVYIVSNSLPLDQKIEVNLVDFYSKEFVASLFTISPEEQTYKIPYYLNGN